MSSSAPRYSCRGGSQQRKGASRGWAPYLLQPIQSCSNRLRYPLRRCVVKNAVEIIPIINGRETRVHESPGVDVPADVFARGYRIPRYGSSTEIHTWQCFSLRPRAVLLDAAVPPSVLSISIKPIFARNFFPRATDTGWERKPVVSRKLDYIYIFEFIFESLLTRK